VQNCKEGDHGGNQIEYAFLAVLVGLAVIVGLGSLGSNLNRGHSAGAIGQGRFEQGSTH